MSSSQRIDEAVEQFLSRVRTMRRGGDLDKLLDEGTDQLLRIVQQEAIRERETAAASDPEAFPPSGLPQMRQSPPVAQGFAPQDDPHAQG